MYVLKRSRADSEAVMEEVAFPLLVQDWAQYLFLAGHGYLQSLNALMEALEQDGQQEGAE